MSRSKFWIKKLVGEKGDERRFSEFRCPKCNRIWMSGYSWANTGQECQRCNVMVYPHKQTPLEKPDSRIVIDLFEPHLQHLCVRCQKIGHNCALGY